jgi:hypothetical protein
MARFVPNEEGGLGVDGQSYIHSFKKSLFFLTLSKPPADPRDHSEVKISKRMRVSEPNFILF